MASINAQVLGGDVRTGIEAETVGQAKQSLGVPGHSASVNGTPKGDEFQLRDNDFVSLSPPVKGGK